MSTIPLPIPAPRRARRRSASASAASAVAAPSDMPNRAGFMILGVLLVLAAALRAFGIASKDAWVDEANAVIIAAGSPAHIVSRLRLDSSPPLYYFLLHGWMKLFGDSEAALRSLSGLFGVGLVAAVFEVARRWFSVRTAVWAALLMAIAPIQVLYAQEIRMYTLLPLVALGAMHFTCEVAMRGGWRAALGAIFCTTLSLYTHNYALFLLPAQAIVALTSGTFRERFRTWLAVGAAVAILYAPWAPILLEQLRNHGQYSWLVPYWKLWGAPRFVVETAHTFALGVGGFAHLGAMRPDAFSAITILFWVLIAIVTWRLGRTSEHGSKVLRLAAFLIVPIGLALGTSFLRSPCYVPGRCDQLVFPAFCLLGALGIDRLKTRLIRTAVAAAVMVCSVFMLVIFYGLNPKAGDRELADAVVSAAKPGEVVLCTSLTRASVEYYARRSGKALTIVSFPRATGEHLGNQDDRALLARPDALREEADRVVEDVKRASGPDGTFLLVTTQKPVNVPLLERLRALGKESTIRFIGDVGSYRQSLVGTPVRVLHYRFAKPPDATGAAPRESTAGDLLANRLPARE
ncbi:MAG: glycosyltransferase family 39 protein [Planctomycetes bacterium]|nr:glycosyltransferase family 39 protein [Planctomycetota bacterium]